MITKRLAQNHEDAEEEEERNTHRIMYSTINSIVMMSSWQKQLQSNYGNHRLDIQTQTPGRRDDLARIIRSATADNDQADA